MSNFTKSKFKIIKSKVINMKTTLKTLRIEAQNLRNQAMKNGGFTVNQDLKEYNGGGYAVGQKGFKYDTVNDLTPMELSRIIKMVKDGQKVGGWLDIDGQFYLDIVKVYDDKQEALEAAAVLGEIAIFDFEAGSEIRL